jgi:hypothetical protein
MRGMIVLRTTRHAERRATFGVPSRTLTGVTWSRADRRDGVAR